MVDEPQQNRPPNRSGEIWHRRPRERSRTVAAVCDALEDAYGRPRLENPDDPLDDLIYIILSNKASMLVARKLFGAIKDQFHQWDAVLESPPSVLTALSGPAG